MTEDEYLNLVFNEDTGHLAQSSRQRLTYGLSNVTNNEKIASFEGGEVLFGNYGLNVGHRYNVPGYDQEINGLGWYIKTFMKDKEGNKFPFFYEFQSDVIDSPKFNSSLNDAGTRLRVDNTTIGYYRNEYQYFLHLKFFLGKEELLFQAFTNL